MSHKRPQTPRTQPSCKRLFFFVVLVAVVVVVADAIGDGEGDWCKRIQTRHHDYYYLNGCKLKYLLARERELEQTSPNILLLILYIIDGLICLYSKVSL